MHPNVHCSTTDDSQNMEVKPEREKQISYINAYMWNLEKWYRRSYLQSRHRDTDSRTNVWIPRGKGRGWDELGDWDSHIYTIDTMYKIGN